MEEIRKRELVDEMLYSVYRVTDEDVDKIISMIDNIAEKQDKSFFDIEEIGLGTYSTVYRLGNKVIKIGGNRATKIIDNNRILIPDQLINIKDNIIEINDYVEGVGDVSEDELYEVYKDLREQGIVWMDPWFNNLGRLNETTLESIEQKLKNRSDLPFIVKNRKFIHRQLKINDPIIIDLDFFVDENDKEEIERTTYDVNDLRLYTRKTFEKRYILEKKKDIE